MRKIILAGAALAVLLLVLLGGVFKVWGDDIALSLIKPDLPFGKDSITVPPDYSDDRYWSSVPGGAGLANLVPAGQSARSSNADVDVFYIHPTSYISDDRWNAPLFANNWAWEIVDRQMASQASAFNGCCDVYAPHYREATLWSFIERDTDDGHKALEFAYRDVESAFDEFLNRFSNGRPFIIASHSQGTVHALRLLSERINNTSLKSRLVAAYLVGYQVPIDYFSRELSNIPPCERATDTGCIAHWATYGEGGLPVANATHYYKDGWETADHKKILCTNPLSWRLDDVLVPATEHTGALAVPAKYDLRHVLLNIPSGEKIKALPAVLPEWTWAQCRDGFLYVQPQLEGPFASARDDETRNYHTRDYSLFYQPIRDNAILRVSQYTLGY